MGSTMRVRAIACAAALTVGVGLIGVAPASAKATYDKTSAKEKRRVDSVPTPKLDWYTCYGDYQCATVNLPRDYDHPKGAKTEIGLLKYAARNPKAKIGTLFVNPGGPGASATEFAMAAPGLLSASLLDRFDVVGVDPRGIGASSTVQCFPSPREQAPVLDTLYGAAFPYGATAEKAFVKASRTLGQGCSSTGRPLSTSMSTAEVARDMDVLRRAVGDKKLSYLGFSYGTYLGQVYANLFPDRVRAVAVDGVLDPVGWAGTKATKNLPLEQRIASAEGAYKALHEILVRCDKAGGQLCRFAPGDPVANLKLIADRLKKAPIQLPDPFTGETFKYDYPAFVSDLLFGLYFSDGASFIESMLSDLIILTEPPAQRGDAGQRASQRTAALRSLVKTVDTLKSRREADHKATGYGFPYDNSIDSFASVTCTDSLETTDIADYPRFGVEADKRAPYFGRLWTWGSAMCAGNAFSGNDEDSYRGAFKKKTIKPVLFVGNYYDPATNYAGAVKGAKLAPNSRLLRSDSWGHTAYGTSDCVTDGVDNYLLKLALPSKKVCVGDDQPFTDESGGPEDNAGLRLQKHLAAAMRR
jgi:pimeloyl-ACP methyl ester carboxylesterase